MQKEYLRDILDARVAKSLYFLAKMYGFTE